MSLKKIAEIVGVSPSTVSRVLNNKSYSCASEEIKAKIWDTAKQLNYAVNQQAKELRTGKGSSKADHLIDVLFTRFSTVEHDPFFQELYRELEIASFKNRCTLNKSLYLHDFTAASRPIHSKSNALIILGKCPSDILPILKKNYSHLVAIDRNPTDYEMDEIICSGISAAKTAVEHLIDLGHSKIAYIGDCSYESRYIGYHESLISNKIPLDYANIYPSTQTKEDGYNIYTQILAKKNRPTAIFCANDFTAIGFLKAMQDNKKSKYFPAVVSIDNIEEAQYTKPLLTTVNIPKDDMANLALTLLLDRINGNHKENVRLELPCRLIIRESCSL